ncbi:ead/Ea22-like family protein [Robbsia andropogonis]|uniref:ead/Ea22-like family protein n=1 Tax=Robbsia andropogonis TaxID=28092 RepID=UPI00046608F8|nr:ead/Ea22-like family protein [Robbsia andropogonis]
MKDKYEALRKAAEKATPGPWTGDRLDGTVKYNLIAGRRENGSERVVIAGDYMGDYGIQTDEDEKYLMVADPTTILELLDELEALKTAIRIFEASGNLPPVRTRPYAELSSKMSEEQKSRVSQRVEEELKKIDAAREQKQ